MNYKSNGKKEENIVFIKKKKGIGKVKICIRRTFVLFLYVKPLLWTPN